MTTCDPYTYIKHITLADDTSSCRIEDTMRYFNRVHIATRCSREVFLMVSSIDLPWSPWYMGALQIFANIGMAICFESNISQLSYEKLIELIAFCHGTLLLIIPNCL